MNAIYDLSRYPASFNFLEFLVSSVTRGARHILLDRSKGVLKKFTDANTELRLKSIVEPACALAGCSYEYGSGEGIDPGYHISAVLKAFKEFGRLEKLKTVLPPKKERYTVTLRNCERHPVRNSNNEEWRLFAKKIGAFLIEDYFDKPISLHERMSYYAGAEMNYFVANGPGSLCLFSDYPCVIFLKGIQEYYHQAQGWFNSDLPFVTKDQHTLWCDDTAENIRKAHESFCNRG